ncbi:MAG: hypothetical protein E5W82_03210 [Mesorhizobium sp.]|nr:MAG: hypothetical protein E5W82_03210 [Mesorhizobium sp.]
MPASADTDVRLAYRTSGRELCHDSLRCLGPACGGCGEYSVMCAGCRPDGVEAEQRFVGKTGIAIRWPISNATNGEAVLVADLPRVGALQRLTGQCGSPGEIG